MENKTNPPKIIAVITTFQREETLKKSLEILSQQTLSLTEIIVVDNANSAATAELVKSFPTATYLSSETNLGGAGGFALGMLTALAHGADYIWLADDDGRPENTEVLNILFTEMQQRDLEEISPVVCDINNSDILAFPLRRGVSWRRKRNELIDPENPDDFIPGIASLFNGALFTKKAVLTVGVPDLRLFIRGDEVEIHRRLVRSGLKFGTCLATAYLHPQGSNEFIPILGGKIHAQYPDNEIKRYYTFRNRGFLLGQSGMRKLVWQEWIRFSWFFLIKKRSLSEFKNWIRLQRLGRKEHLYHYENKT